MNITVTSMTIGFLRVHAKIIVCFILVLNNYYWRGSCRLTHCIWLLHWHLIRIRLGRILLLRRVMRLLHHVWIWLMMMLLFLLVTVTTGLFVFFTMRIVMNIHLMRWHLPRHTYVHINLWSSVRIHIHL